MSEAFIQGITPWPVALVAAFALLMFGTHLPPSGGVSSRGSRGLTNRRSSFRRLRWDEDQRPKEGE